jgi:hypothetical protein
VKLVLRREQMYGPVGHRAPTRQTLRLGADRQGALTAIHHHMRTATSSFDDFFEPSVQVSHTLYASPAIATTMIAPEAGLSIIRQCGAATNRCVMSRLTKCAAPGPFQTGIGEGAGSLRSSRCPFTSSWPANLTRAG